MIILCYYYYYYKLYYIYMNINEYTMYGNIESVIKKKTKKKISIFDFLFFISFFF